MQYIDYIKCPRLGIKTAVLSQEDENLFDFAIRIKKIYPNSEDYHHQFSRFKVIF